MAHASNGGLLWLAVRRHLILLVVTTLAGLGVAFAYGATLHRAYSAEATVLPRPAIGNPLSPDTATASTSLTVAMQTEAALVGSPAVIELASRAVHHPVLRPGDSVTATVPMNTQIVKITYTSGSALAARRGADALASAFLKYREEVAGAARDRLVESLQRQALRIQSALSDAVRAAAKVKDPRSIAAQQVDLYRSRLVTLQARLTDAQALGTDPGTVVSTAALPTSRNGLDPLVVTVAGALLGLLVGLAFAVRSEWRRRPVVGSSAPAVDLPVLASIPATAPGLVRLADHPSDSPETEAYRRLRAGVQATTDPPYALGVMCASAGQTSARVAMNLAESFSAAGLRVIVVTTDLDDRTVEALFDVAPGPGLAEIMVERAHIDDSLQAVGLVDVLTTGYDGDSIRERLAGPSLTKIVGRLKQQADYVIVAGPSSERADSDSVALACDGVLLLLTEGATSQEVGIAAAHHLERLGSGQVLLTLVAEAGTVRHRIPLERESAAGTRQADAPAAEDPPAPRPRSSDNGRAVPARLDA